MKYYFYFLLIVLFACKKNDDSISGEIFDHTLQIYHSNTNPAKYKFLYFINDNDGNLIKTIDPKESLSPINITFKTNKEDFIFSEIHMIGKFDENLDSATYISVTSFINFKAETYNAPSTVNSHPYYKYYVKFTNCMEDIRISYPGGYDFVWEEGTKLITSYIDKPSIILTRGEYYNSVENGEYSIIKINHDTLIDLGTVNWNPTKFKEIKYTPISFFNNQSFFHFIFSQSDINFEQLYYYSKDNVKSENGIIEIRSFPELRIKEGIRLNVRNGIGETWIYEGLYDSIPDSIELYNDQYVVTKDNDYINVETSVDCNLGSLFVNFNENKINWVINFPGGNKSSIPVIKFPAELKNYVVFDESNYQLSSIYLAQYKDQFDYEKFCSTHLITFKDYWLLRSVTYSLDK